MLDAVLKHLAAHTDAALGRLQELLAIPSISTDPTYAEHLQRGADWVVHALREAGLEADIVATAGHPIVLGRTRQARPGRHVLFYGHYDVQPPDPLEAWTSPPFEPTVRDGNLYARGASDDKGPVCCFIEALRAWQAVDGGPPVNVTVLIEGEEEIGSVNTSRYVAEHHRQLVADPADTVALISDTTMWNRETIAITYGLRGALFFDVQLHGPKRDLHSGLYGGILANPANRLTAVLGRLFDDQNRVTIPGFYDDVLPLDATDRARWAELGFDDRKYLADVGVEQPCGEAGYDTLERKWVRPACDINGLYGGYGGEGAKTIIPAFAGAKVSFRLAPNQDPQKIAAAFCKWLESNEVGGCRWQITDLGHAYPVVVPTDSPQLAATSRAIEHITGQAPVLVREGATIPIVADFKKALGIDSLLVGFGLESDCIHSPNERFALDRFQLGSRVHAAILAELAR
jgi:acetylornithine deacetylase/succinyl-diaminopimelate desuccinylase-like protein